MASKTEKQEKPMVKRYWPGKAPSYAKDEEETFLRRDTSAGVAKPSETSQNDRRLQRLAQRDIGNKEDARARHKVDLAEVVSVGQKDETEDAEVPQADQHLPDVESRSVNDGMDVDDEDPEERRARARARLRQEQEQDQEELLPRQEEEAEEASSSEYETDDDDEFPSRPTFTAVFVRKDERETIREREQREKEEEEWEEKNLERLKERKRESHKLVSEEVKRDLEEQQKEKNKDSDGEGEIPDDRDHEENEMEEFEKWKIRELNRIKKEKEEREAHEKEKAELERRRKMTDSEIKEEDREKFKPKVKTKYKFLQKYYHKGAFHQDLVQELAEKGHNFDSPTLEDKFEKTMLPKVMQVKNFGRSGRTKYTHLADQDTTDFNSLWAQNDTLRSKYVSKMGGVGSLDPYTKRQKKEK